MTLTPHQFQIAHPLPPGDARKVGGRNALLRRPPAAPYQHQTWTDTERGLAREVMCPSAPAVGRRGLQSGFFPSVTMSSLQSTGRALGLGTLSAGSRGACRRSLACNHPLGNRVLKAFAKGSEHSSAPRRYVSRLTEGASGSVPKQSGKVPKEQGERHHVSRV